MTSIADVQGAYQNAIDELQSVAASLDATSAQKRAASKALDDLLLAHGTFVLQQIEGRTAMLTALISELEGVIKKIETNPFGDALDSINGLIDRARTLYEQAKKDLKTS